MGAAIKRAEPTDKYIYRKEASYDISQGGRGNGRFGGGRFTALTNAERAQLVLVVDVVYEPASSAYSNPCGLERSPNPPANDARAFESRVWQHFKLMKSCPERQDSRGGALNHRHRHPTTGVNCIIAECCFQIFN